MRARGARDCVVSFGCAGFLRCPVSGMNSGIKRNMQTNRLREDCPLKNLMTLAMTAVLALSAPLMAQAGDAMQLVYEEHIEGVYYQHWSAQVLGDRVGEGVEIYVVGDGKMGDFFGVISVNCETPAYSSWLATGGYLNTSNLPEEAIAGIRKLAC